jgi:hypothetical protein
MKASGQLHVPATLPPEKEPPESIGYRRLGLSQEMSSRESNPGRTVRDLVTILTELPHLQRELLFLQK